MTATAHCPNCGERLDLSLTSCANCGAPRLITSSAPGAASVANPGVPHTPAADPSVAYAQPAGQSTATKVINTGVNGVNIVMKLFTTALWALGGFGAFASGAWWLGIIAIFYLVYLWVFGGRWLIY